MFFVPAPSCRREPAMQFDERIEGDFHIYVGTLESPSGDGYIAAAAVKRLHGAAGRGREVWRDDSLACGHRWASPDAALQYAMARAREVVRSFHGTATC
jgi:hypothetical protein